MAEYEVICHTFEPVYDAQSRILILGSFPSVKSREQGFYYGHPQNRFWKVLAAIFCCQIPTTTEEKKKLLLENHIAVWAAIVRRGFCLFAYPCCLLSVPGDTQI